MQAFELRQRERRNAPCNLLAQNALTAMTIVSTGLRRVKLFNGRYIFVETFVYCFVPLMKKSLFHDETILISLDSEFANTICYPHDLSFYISVVYECTLNIDCDWLIRREDKSNRVLLILSCKINRFIIGVWCKLYIYERGILYVGVFIFFKMMDILLS